MISLNPRHWRAVRLPQVSYVGWFGPGAGTGAVGAGGGGGRGPVTRRRVRRLITRAPVVYPRTTSTAIQARCPDPDRTNVAPGRLYATQCGTGAVPGR